jgi:hypothetical protein
MDASPRRLQPSALHLNSTARRRALECAYRPLRAHKMLPLAATTARLSARCATVFPLRREGTNRASGGLPPSWSRRLRALAAPPGMFAVAICIGRSTSSTPDDRDAKAPLWCRRSNALTDFWCGSRHGPSTGMVRGRQSRSTTSAIAPASFLASANISRMTRGTVEKLDSVLHIRIRAAAGQRFEGRQSGFLRLRAHMTPIGTKC